MELEILDDAALARRWFKDKEEGITPEAIAKWIDRICNRDRAGPLKYFKAGNKRLFRLEDVKEFEARAKNLTASLAQMEFTDDDLAELDPAARFDEKTNQTKQRDSTEWIRLARLTGLDKQE
jgi:hypothetical protein